MADTEIGSELINRRCLGFVAEHRNFTDQEKPGNPDQGGHDVHRQPVTEIVLFWIDTQIHKGQNRKGRFIGKWQCFMRRQGSLSGSNRWCGLIHPGNHPINAHRIRNILQRLRPHINKFKFAFVANLGVNKFRNTEPTGFGKALQTGGDVDPVTIYDVSIYQDVSQVDSNAKIHLPIFSEIGIQAG